MKSCEIPKSNRVKRNGVTSNSSDERLHQSHPGVLLTRTGEMVEASSETPPSEDGNLNTTTTTTMIAIPTNPNTDNSTNSSGSESFSHHYHHCQRDLPAMMTNLITLKENDINPTLEKCVRAINISVMAGQKLYVLCLSTCIYGEQNNYD